MSRRDFLKKVGLAGVAGLAVATSVRHLRPLAEPSEPGPPEPPVPPTEETPAEPELPTDRFETVVDVVEEGADPDGDEPVDPIVRDVAADDTLLVFPPGTYAMDFFALSGLSNLGLVSGEDDRATLVPTEGNCRGGHPYVHFDSISDLLVDGVDFDFRGVDSGGPLHLFLEGESVVRNVAIHGSCSNQISLMRVDVRAADGTARFENLAATNGEDNQSLTGLYVGKHHAGELVFRDCEIEGFSDNGLYASAPGLEDGQDGAVHVDGGTFANNNVANVRLGSSGSTCDDVTVRVDRQPPGWGDLNARGIRLRGRRGQVIRNCDLTITADGADSFGAVVFHPSNDGATVRETQIRVDRDAIPALRAFATAEETDEKPVFENLAITGTASRGVVASIEGRPGTEFRGCTVEQPGNERAGLRLANSPGCRIADCRIETGTDPIVLERSWAEITNTTIATPEGERQLENGRYEDEVLTVS